MATKGVNARSMRANNGGKNHGATTSLKSKGGNVKGASKSPIPSQKKSTGSGIAGRGTR